MDFFKFYFPQKWKSILSRRFSIPTVSSRLPGFSAIAGLLMGQLKARQTDGGLEFEFI